MDKKKVLIVEDELIISLLIEEMVKSLGHEVMDKVVTGEEAVNLALEQKPDLILMDIRLRGEMDGIEAMAKIKQKANIPVIYITGNTDQVYRNRVEKSEYLAFLTKPVTINDLSKSFGLAS